MTDCTIILWSLGIMLTQWRASGGREASIRPVLARLDTTSLIHSAFAFDAVTNWLSDESRPPVSA
ncbi:hypothetical protein C8Q77DRAFT_1144348 [Trametes polyzona]|nr:hypothetical protein C8Q77DRAFT_1144348 [Trametes polyzona]